MVNQQRLQELYEKGRQSGFKLPKSVTVKKEYSYEGYLIHIFRHDLLGDLGRIVIIPNSNTKTNIHCEIAGDPDDTMTKRRQKIFEPIAREITKAMDEILGKSDEAVDEILRNGLEQSTEQYNATNIGHGELGGRNAVFENAYNTLLAQETNYNILIQETGGADLAKLAMESAALDLTYQSLYTTIGKMNQLSLLNYL